MLFRSQKKKWVQLRHIKTIDASLQRLGVYSKAPSFDGEPQTWVPFLKFALAKIKDEPVSEVVAENSREAEPGTTIASTDAHARTTALARSKPDDQQVDSKMDEASPTPIAREQDAGSGLPGQPEFPEASTVPSEQNDSLGAPRPKISGRRFRWRRVLVSAFAIFLIAVVGIIAAAKLGVISVVQYTPVAQVGQPSTEVTKLTQALSHAGSYAAVVDPKLWTGLRADALWTSKGLPQNTAIDPRLRQAFQLKRDEKTSDADQIVQDVIREWSSTQESANKAAAEAHRQLGKLAYQTNYFEIAVAEFEQTIKYDPRAEDFNSIGVALDQQHRESDAVAYYERAIEADKNYAWSYNNRGSAHLEQEPSDLDRAIEDFNEAIRIDPDFSEALSNRGDAFFRQTKYDLAVLDYHRAIELKARLAQPYNGLGMVSADQGNYDQAIKYFDLAIEADEKFTPAWLNRGITYLNANDIVHAISDFCKSLIA